VKAFYSLGLALLLATTPCGSVAADPARTPAKQGDRVGATGRPLPAEADDPNRPAHTRQLKPSVWTDDAGVDDNGNIYNQYRRSSFGTWSNYD